MKKIVQWLREKEHQANNFYEFAASHNADNATLKKFLEHAAEDEAWHYHVMGSAAEFLSSQPDFTPFILIDPELKAKIDNQFAYLKKGLEENSISETELIEKITEVELTEWNDIFVYTVNFLKEKTSEFKYPAARIQNHIREIEYFLEVTENHPELLKKIKELDPVWIENILIVDDEEMITELIKSLLNSNSSGNIDIAHNGKAALKLMEDKYYKLIISDIDMPKMDGITFYKEACQKYPKLSNKFLFMTGDLSPERQTFFNENQIKYLSKPVSIMVLREVAAEIISSK